MQRKVWVVACREYLATARTRAFIISIVSMPIFMMGGFLMMKLQESLEDRGVKKFVLIDRSPGQSITPVLRGAVDVHNKKEIIDEKTGEPTGPAFEIVEIAPSADDPQAIEQQRLELSERVRKGEFAGILEIGSEVARKSTTASSFFRLLGNANSESAKPSQKTDPNKDKPSEDSKTSEEPADKKLNDRKIVRFQARPTSSGVPEFRRWCESRLPGLVLTKRLELVGINTVQQMDLFQLPKFQTLGLSERLASGSVDDGSMAKTAAPIVVTVSMVALMYMIVLVSTMPFMQSTLEEKMQRIAEVLLGSITPFDLMLGKLLGSIGVSLTLAAVYLGGAYGAAYYYGQIEHVPLPLIGWFLFYLILSMGMYGSMFIAVGAACNDMKEPQTLMMPILVPMMIPMFALGNVLSDPDGMIARVVSYFPPSTPAMMLARQAMAAGIQWWEPLVGAVLVVGMSLFCVWAAGRVFRVGILMQGKGADLKTFVRWIFTG